MPFQKDQPLGGQQTQTVRKEDEVEGPLGEAAEWSLRLTCL